MFNLARDGDAPVNRFTRRRVLGRPRAMEAAREALLEELERQRPAAVKPENHVDSNETNSRGTEINPTKVGKPGEDGGRR